MALATTTRPKTKKQTPEEKICSEVIKLLESGVQPWQKEWTTSTSASYRNFITGHKYSGANIALLSLYESVRGYRSTLYCGFAQCVLGYLSEENLRITAEYVTFVIKH